MELQVFEQYKLSVRTHIVPVTWSHNLSDNKLYKFGNNYLDVFSNKYIKHVLFAKRQTTVIKYRVGNVFTFQQCYTYNCHTYMYPSELSQLN